MNFIQKQQFNLSQNVFRCRFQWERGQLKIVIIMVHR